MVENTLVEVLLGFIAVCIMIGFTTLIKRHEKQERAIFEKRQQAEQELQKDYEKVAKIIDSCKTRDQMNTALNVIIRFEIKYKFLLENMCRERSKYLHTQYNNKLRRIY